MTVFLLIAEVHQPQSNVFKNKLCVTDYKDSNAASEMFVLWYHFYDLNKLWTADDEIIWEPFSSLCWYVLPLQMLPLEKQLYLVSQTLCSVPDLCPSKALIAFCGM